MSDLLTHSLLYATILSGLSAAVLLLSAWLNPESMVDDYPPDIRTQFGPMSPAARRHKKLVGLPFGLILIGLLALSNMRLPEITFYTVFVNTAVMLVLFNLVDLLLLDWLLFNTIRPRFMVLPGTEGMPGYADYGFHFRQFLKGTAGALIGSLLIAAFAALFSS